MVLGCDLVGDCGHEQNDIKNVLLHYISILGPLGYGPNTLPLRHGADQHSLLLTKYINYILQPIIITTSQTLST